MMCCARHLKRKLTQKSLRTKEMSRSETRMNSLAAKEKSEQKKSERTNLDQSGHQPDCDTAFATIHWCSVAAEERVIAVRNATEICLSSSTRENVPDEMRTSWKLSRRDEDSGRDQDRAENCSDSTRAMRSTDGPGR